LVNVNALVEEVLATLEVDLRTQQVSVSIALSESLPPLVGERGQLQQRFLNLIMNAMSAVTDRTRSLRVTSDTIQEAFGIMVTVEDSGSGIRSEDKDGIFEAFFTTKTGAEWE
jgi:C4-dicarboxylate-specific signal transduction histidine kinase